MRTSSVLFALVCMFLFPFAGSVRPAVAVAKAPTIYWTAPGDDSLTGQATAYDLRWSLAPITPANFSLATRVTGVPAPKPSGSAESFTVANLAPGTSYYFALKTVDEAANWSGISNIVYLPGGTAAVRVPTAPWFSSPWPNPAHGSARWAWALPEPGQLLIDAFDSAGRQVAIIANGPVAAGRGEAAWDLRDGHGRTVPAGVYLVRVTFDGKSSVHRLAVVQ